MLGHRLDVLLDWGLLYLGWWGGHLLEVDPVKRNIRHVRQQKNADQFSCDCIHVLRHSSSNMAAFTIVLVIALMLRQLPDVLPDLGP